MLPHSPKTALNDTRAFILFKKMFFILEKKMRVNNRHWDSKHDICQQKINLMIKTIKDNPDNKPLLQMIRTKTYSMHTSIRFLKNNKQPHQDPNYMILAQQWAALKKEITKLLRKNTLPLKHQSDIIQTQPICSDPHPLLLEAIHLILNIPEKSLDINPALDIAQDMPQSLSCNNLLDSEVFVFLESSMTYGITLPPHNHLRSYNPFLEPFIFDHQEFEPVSEPVSESERLLPELDLTVPNPEEPLLSLFFDDSVNFTSLTQYDLNRPTKDLNQDRDPINMKLDLR